MKDITDMKMNVVPDAVDLSEFSNDPDKMCEWEDILQVGLVKRIEFIRFHEGGNVGFRGCYVSDCIGKTTNLSSNHALRSCVRLPIDHRTSGFKFET